MNKICINSANLHVGGGVQVAVSFLAELLQMDAELLENVSVFASSEVDRNLKNLDVNVSLFNSYEIINVYGFRSFFSGLDRRFKDFNVVFTVFGPEYSLRRGCRHIVGFAQPWILYPSNEIFRSLSFFQKVLISLKYKIQWLFFKSADQLIVELDHAKFILETSKNFPSEKIEVVLNTISSVYMDKSKWDHSRAAKLPESAFKVGIVSRDYPHKNLNVLVPVSQILKDKYLLNVDFFVTLTEQEWEMKDEVFRTTINNVGSLTVAQCPPFYESLDAVIFPTLLECFSATPLEAMYMKKPLFASDRPFVRDVCKNFAIYFDPLAPEDIAKKIAIYLLSEDNENLEDAFDYVRKLSSARVRAEKYMSILLCKDIRG